MNFIHAKASVIMIREPTASRSRTCRAARIRTMIADALGPTENYIPFTSSQFIGCRIGCDIICTCRTRAVPVVSLSALCVWRIIAFAGRVSPWLEYLLLNYASHCTLVDSTVV